MCACLCKYSSNSAQVCVEKEEYHHIVDVYLDLPQSKNGIGRDGQRYDADMYVRGSHFVPMHPADLSPPLIAWVLTHSHPVVHTHTLHYPGNARKHTHIHILRPSGTYPPTSRSPSFTIPLGSLRRKVLLTVKRYYPLRSCGESSRVMPAVSVVWAGEGVVCVCVCVCVVHLARLALVTQAPTTSACART